MNKFTQFLESDDEFPQPMAGREGALRILQEHLPELERKCKVPLSGLTWTFYRESNQGILIRYVFEGVVGNVGGLEVGVRAYVDFHTEYPSGQIFAKLYTKPGFQEHNGVYIH